MQYTIIVEFGNTYWYKEGTNLLHREGGPAVEFANGTKVWYHHSKLHRIDGPAVEFANGNKFWYLDGKEYTEAEFMEKTQPALYEGKIIEVNRFKYKLIKYF